MPASKREKNPRWFRTGREMLFDPGTDWTELHYLTRDPTRVSSPAWWRGPLAEHLRDRPEGPLRDRGTAASDA